MNWSNSVSVDFNGKPFHFIGIGGIGMSGLAYILAQRGIPIAGSDLGSTHLTKRLQQLGVKTFNSQNGENLDYFVSQQQQLSQQPQIICSTAIHLNNGEYQAAVAKGYPIFHRSDVLAGLVSEYESIAVAGTHGKTTTSSLLGYVLWQVGLDPTVVVGGEVPAWQGNARVGQSPYLVAEADESDGSLVKLHPKIGIITNIELDHPDHYQDLSGVTETFQTFAAQTETLVACLDCQTLCRTVEPDIGYSLDPDQGADYTVTEVHYTAQGVSAMIWEQGSCLGSIQLQLLGSHNLKNALAVIAVARQLGVDFASIASAIAQFTGAKRRFEVYGEQNGIVFVDDYAHHPTELVATLDGAKLQVNHQKAQRLVAIFQPHRYSRTKAFLHEFATAFNQADMVVLTDIYSAGEACNEISGKRVADAIAQYHDNVVYHQDVATLADYLKHLLRPGDLALFLGAGNLNKIIPQTMANFAKDQVA